MKTGVIVLSRFNSSRLPGKALMKIGEKTILDLIVERLLVVFAKEEIVIATSAEKSDDAIEHYTRERGLKCYRGSLENVAERFLAAAEDNGFDFAIRINGDNVFVDTDVLQTMIRLTNTDKYDFISNVKGRTFPKGMSIEIVRTEYYRSLIPEINKADQYKEHVTLYLYEHEGQRFYYHFNTDLPEASGIQMALDTREDFERTQKIFNHFVNPHYEYNLADIIKIWKSIEKNEQSI